MEAMTRAELEAILDALMALDPESAGWPEARIDLQCSLWNRAAEAIEALDVEAGRIWLRNNQ
jgi:hypothetical protein